MIDEFGPEKHEAKRLIGLVLLNFLKETTRAWLWVIGRLNFCSEPSKNLSERVAGPNKKLTETLLPVASMIQALANIFDHLCLRFSHKFVRELDTLFTLGNCSILLAVKVARVFVF